MSIEIGDADAVADADVVVVVVSHEPEVPRPGRIFLKFGGFQQFGFKVLLQAPYGKPEVAWL